MKWPRGGDSAAVASAYGCELRKRQLDRMGFRWDHGCVTCAQPGAFSAIPRARPLWSLSVEDLKQWRRLCLAMLAGLIPAWFLKYADCNDAYTILKPSLPGYKR
jgi:hypothetical protein